MNRAILTLILLSFVGYTYAQNNKQSTKTEKNYRAIYNEFRAEVIKEYTEFMEMAWKSYGMKDPIPFPVKKWDDPKQYDKEQAQKELEAEKRKLAEEQKVLKEKRQQQEQRERELKEKNDKLQLEQLAEEKKKLEIQELQLEKREKNFGKGVEIAINSKPIVPLPSIDKIRVQPQPIFPIEENDIATETNSFEYYGTPMEVRWADLASFKLAGTDGKSIVNAYQKLSNPKYNNLLHDCLEIRKDYDLCDWAYFKFLQALAEAACGKGTNEAVFVQGYLFQESGYKMRFGLDEQKNLHLLNRVNGIAYGSGYTSVNGELYFLFDGSRLNNLEVCDLAYPKTKIMELDIDKLPKLNIDRSEKRTIVSQSISIQADIVVNKNIISFFNDYPSSYKDNEIMTCWAYYANTPISEEVKQEVYPQLEKHIKNGPKLMGANLLLNWVQIGFDYAKDPIVWGRERTFFAEESLFYPKCDCEDRAILYSHLVRDLLGLDVILIYYPEHIYTAICFDEPVDGDHIMVEGRKFVVADPTYYFADVGRTMSSMDNSKAKVILLKKN